MRDTGLKHIVFMGIFVLLFIMTAVISNAADPLPQLTLHSEFSFPPYNWVENEEYKGIDLDIVREACQRAGISPVFKNRPWKRVLKEVETGEADGGFSSFMTPEREAFAHFLTGSPLHYSTYSIFAKQGREFPYKKVEDLFGKRLGIVRGFAINKDFDDAVKAGKIIVEEVTALEQNILKLLADRIDAFVHQQDLTMYALKTKKFQGNVVMLPVPIEPARPAYLIISKAAKIPQKEQLTERLNTALKNMQEDGTIANICDKYLK